MGTSAHRQALDWFRTGGVKLILVQGPHTANLISSGPDQGGVLVAIVDGGGGGAGRDC